MIVNCIKLVPDWQMVHGHPGLDGCNGSWTTSGLDSRAAGANKTRINWSKSHWGFTGVCFGRIRIQQIQASQLFFLYIDFKNYVRPCLFQRSWQYSLLVQGNLRPIAIVGYVVSKEIVGHFFKHGNPIFDILSIQSLTLKHPILHCG